MRRRHLLVLLASVLALVGACGPEAHDQPAAPAQPPSLPPLEPSVDARPTSALERIRERIRTWVTVGGPEAELQIRRLYQEIVDEHDPDDLEARRYLGYTDFQADVLGRLLAPGEDAILEEIANREGYAFLDAVRTLAYRRWLRGEEEIELARRAVAAMHEHVRMLREDHRYRLGDTIRANVAMDSTLNGLNYATTWGPPHLICYASDDYLSDFHLLALPYEKRCRKKAELEARRKKFEPLLAEKARVFSQLYAEFLRRYGERLRLKDLSAPYGGRPDHRVGVRSYPDGVPLVVWVFEDARAFQRFHELCHGYRRGFPTSGGYFRTKDGVLYVYDEDPDECSRDERVRADVQMAVQQFLYWFTRQRNNWRAPTESQSFFGAGLANYLAGVRLDEGQKLEFIGLNPDLLDDAQRLDEAYRRLELPYPFFPLEKLVGFTRYRDATDWAEKELDLSYVRSFQLYVRQSWMFVTFLHEYDDGRYHEAFLKYFDALLDRQTGHGMAPTVMLRCLGLEEDAWPRLDREFQAFVKEDLLKRDAP